MYSPPKNDTYECLNVDKTEQNSCEWKEVDFGNSFKLDFDYGLEIEARHMFAVALLSSEINTSLLGRFLFHTYCCIFNFV